jgi:hypothetical protein
MPTGFDLQKPADRSIGAAGAQAGSGLRFHQYR